MTKREEVYSIIRSARRRPGLWEWVGYLFVFVFLAFLVLPLISLFLQVPLRQLLDRLSNSLVLEALRLSIFTSVSSTVLVVAGGLPLALLLATKSFFGRRVLETVINLPMVLPPTVAGLGLLLAFGRMGLTGRWLAAAGVSIPFTTLAVVLAETFVAAPFFINAARAGIESVEVRYLKAAVTLRASPLYIFFRVVLPMCSRSLIAGTAMAWARALGEFGATLTFAGNMPGKTQTMPLAVFVALQTDLAAAVTLGVILLVVAFALLFMFRLITATAEK